MLLHTISQTSRVKFCEIKQNFDIIYAGKIDVVRKVPSNNPKIPDVTNSFKDVGVSISILNNSTLSHKL